MSKPEIAIFWFRRDLRLHDNAGLYHALTGAYPVLPIFIFDRNILDELEDKKDRRVNFIYQAIKDLQRQLIRLESSLEVFYGTPTEVFRKLIDKYNIKAVFTNHDYEPYARKRDSQIAQLLQEKGIPFHTYKDQCIFEKQEILTNTGSSYTIFTPYSKKWLLLLTTKHLESYPTESYWGNFYKQSPQPIITLQEMSFQEIPYTFPSKNINEEILQHYSERRNYPALEGTSKLGVHLRFGTISIRELARKAHQLNTTFLNEIIWRDFYMMILWNFPHVTHQSFKPEYDHIEWRNNPEEFARWCEGQTGYPIVDAGMRELNQTGYMHNRVRMIAASFLTKHLLIDWRWGESYFAKKLLDFELASNNGGWQWASGSGCDAAPYFRIFNPTEQTKKFDPHLQYIRKWVPEFGELTYPKPIVEHTFARQRAIETYRKALQATKLR